MFIYGKVKSHFGNLWAFASMLVHKSRTSKETVFVSNKMIRAKVVKDILNVLDTTDASIEWVDEMYSEGQRKYGTRRHKYDYVNTKVRWKNKRHNRICYQLHTDTKGRDEKKIDNAEIEEILSKMPFECVKLGHPLSMEEDIKIASESDLFIGIDSGMAHLCHSVGVPVFLKDWRLLRRCHPKKEYVPFDSVDDIVSKVNTFVDDIDKNTNVFEFKNMIRKVYAKEKQDFGNGIFYQSYEPLNIKGFRATESRFHIYGIEEFLSKDKTVLDVGCNCGFFDNYVSKYVKSIMGLDVNRSLIDIAQRTATFLGNSNLTFVSSPYSRFMGQDKYDVIFLLAIYRWAQMDYTDFCDKTLSYLKKGGIILLESHNMPWEKSKKRNFPYKRICEYLASQNMKVEKTGDIDKRKFSIWKK
jgi:2-polyprenyl-3-methyl-5-hydroxy-6-metoxy-1,4-benzoquinol methylase